MSTFPEAQTGCMQVGFQKFLERNWLAIVAIYEDQHLLWGFTQGGRIVRRPVSMRRAKVRRLLPLCPCPPPPSPPP